MKIIIKILLIKSIVMILIIFQPILKSGKISKIKNFKINSENKYFVAFISKKNNKISRRNNKYNYNIEIYSFLSNNEEYYDDEDDENEEEDKLEDIPPQYRDIAKVFSKKKADKLPPHRPVDCNLLVNDLKLISGNFKIN